MFADLYLPRIEQNCCPCYVSASLPLLLMPQYGCCVRDGGGYRPVFSPTSDSLATRQGWPSPACLCIMEKLFAFLR